MSRGTLGAGVALLALVAGLAVGAAAEGSGSTAAVRSPETILAQTGGRPAEADVLEIYRNASEWDAAHQEVRDSSQQALIELGAPALPPILAEYLASTDVRRRNTLDEIVAGIGHPAARLLLPYVQRGNAESRRHAVSLLATTSFAARQEDARAPGPFPEDREIARALRRALDRETDPTVLRAVLVSAGRLRDPAWVGRLAPFLDRPEEPIRLQAVLGLAAIPDASAARALLPALGDPLGSVRQAAILALAAPVLGELGFEALVEAAGAGPAGTRRQLAALEALARHAHACEAAAEEGQGGLPDARRAEIGRLAHELLEAAAASPGLRAQLVPLLRIADPADPVLADLARTETHPLVRGRLMQ